MHQDISKAVAASARIGSFFTVPLAEGDDWRPFAEFTGSREAVDDYILRTRGALAIMGRVSEDDVELRVAASSFHLNAVARLLSPMFGCAVLAEASPDMGPENLVWRPGPAHAIEIGLRALAGGAELSDAELVQRMHDGVIDGPVAALGEALAEATGLSRKVLWGNVASAVNGAFLVLRGQRPDDEDRAHELMRAIVEHGQLDGAGHFLPDEWDEDRFSRNNCCLFYRLPGAGMCGDCVLAERPDHEV